MPVFHRNDFQESHPGGFLRRYRYRPWLRNHAGGKAQSFDLFHSLWERAVLDAHDQIHNPAVAAVSEVIPAVLVPENLEARRAVAAERGAVHVVPRTAGKVRNRSGKEYLPRGLNWLPVMS